MTLGLRAPVCTDSWASGLDLNKGSQFEAPKSSADQHMMDGLAKQRRLQGRQPNAGLGPKVGVQPSLPWF